VLKIYKLKKNIKKRFWILISILILPGFLLWGSETILIHRPRNYVGIVFGEKISLAEFQSAIKAIQHQLILQKGEEFLSQKNTIDLSTEAWDRIILLKEVKRRKIKVSDKEVIEFIQSLPLFRSNNKFDLGLYKQIIYYLFKTDPRSFEEEMRENLMISKLYDELTSDIKLTEEEIEISYRQENEMIAVEYLSIPFKNLEKSVSVDENELYQYYLDHRQEFKKPATYNLQYISEKDPEKIKQLYNNLRRTKNFEGFLKEKGYTINETGFFSLEEPIPAIELPVSSSFLIENLKIGKVSPPLKIKDNYFLIRLKEKREAYIPNFTEIKDKVKEKFLDEKIKKQAKELLTEVLSEIKRMKENNLEVDFSKLANQYNLKYGTTEPFKRSTYIPQIGSSDKFFKAFDELKEGKISKEIIPMEQAMFIARIVSYKGPDKEIYEKEKEEFSKNLTQKVKDIRFMEFLWQLRRKAKLISLW